MLVRDHYDDGGISGGTLDRPALQRLLPDIEDGLVDVVVVYKIDRLSRSLMDFSKLVEVFDRNNVTFVTRHPELQHHHLHGAADPQHPAVLRPVRARGDGRAHPRQGQGQPHEGHLHGRHPALRLQAEGPEAGDRRGTEAKNVRWIFARFLEIGSATELAREVARRGIRTPRGNPMSKNFLYRMLNNRAYIGEAVHKGTGYAGEHQRLIDQRTWDKVQSILQESPRLRANNTRAETPALLKGLLYGPDGAAFSPTHTRKGDRLYRYYVSQTVLKHGAGKCPVARVPAAEIEAAVIDQIRGMLRAPEVVMATWRAAQPECEGLAEDEVREALAALDPLWAELFPAEQARIIQLLIERVDIGTDGLKLRFRDKGLAQMVAEVGIIAGKSRKAAA